MRVRFFRIFRMILLASVMIGAMPVEAKAVNISDELLSHFGADELIELLPEYAKNIANDVKLSDFTAGEVLSLSPEKLLLLIKKEISSSVGSYRQLVLSLLGLVMLFASCKALCDGSFLGQATGKLGGVFIVLLLSKPMVDVVFRTGEAITGASKFLIGYVPVFAAVAAASGSVSTAAFYHAAVIAAAQAVSAVSSRALVPLGCIYLELCIAESFSGELLPKWSANVKKAVNWILVLTVTAFAGLLSLQSTLTGAADSAGVKTVKFLAGAFIPVIGSAVGDAVQAAQGSIKIIRASIGSFGIVAAIIVMAPIVLRILFLRLSFGAAAVLADTLSAARLSMVIRSMGHLLSVLTAIVMTMALLMIISTAVILTAGGAFT